MLGIDRMRAPVSPEPVKATTSCGADVLEDVADASPPGAKRALGQHALLHQQLGDAVGHQAELVAGLLTTGTPASSATAAFSAKPQAGKLNALMWTATPRRGASRWIA